MVLKDTSKVSSEQVLVGPHRVEAQRSQKAVLENIRNAKGFNLVRRDTQRQGEN